VATGLIKITVFIVLAPILGMALGFILMVATLRTFRSARPSRVDALFPEAPAGVGDLL
jgi:phosphate/sulfate permease